MTAGSPLTYNMQKHYTSIIQERYRPWLPHRRALTAYLLLLVNVTSQYRAERVLCDAASEKQRRENEYIVETTVINL